MSDENYVPPGVVDGVNVHGTTVDDICAIVGTEDGGVGSYVEVNIDIDVSIEEG